MENEQINKKMIDIESLCKYAESLYSDMPFIGNRNNTHYSWSSYDEVLSQVSRLSKFFKVTKRSDESGLFTMFEHSGKKNYMVGVFSKNCQEYLMTMLACHSAQITILPLYENITDKDLNFILNETKIKTLFVDEYGYENLKSRVPNLDGRECLKKFICFKKLNNSSDELNIKYGIETINISELFKAEIGSEDIHGHKEENPILLLNYTCNYKSESKGVLITEEALLSTLNDLADNYNFNIDKEDTYYSMNCMAEIQEYIIILLLLYSGAKVGFSSQDLSMIFEDFEILKPSMLYSYPRILNKIFDALHNTINKLDEAKKNMIDKAIKMKADYYSKQGSLNHHIWDKLLFDKIKNKLGGKLRLILVGGGNLPHHISEFLKVCLSSYIVNIYGVAESCGIITLYDPTKCFLGDKLNSLEVKISKCNKIGYYSPTFDSVDISAKSHGEICIRGRNMFIGYFNKAYSFDKDGWFHTGDYAISVEEQSTGLTKYRFIDRIENFIKSKLGFWISPMQLEEYYSASQFISNISIIQDKHLNLIGIVSLNNVYQIKSDKKRKNSSSDSRVEYVRRKSMKAKSKFAIEENELTDDSTTNKDSDTFINDQLKEDPNLNEQLKQEIFNSFKCVTSNYKLKAHEQVDKIFIIDKRTIQENEILTCKMKIRKDKLKEIYNAYGEYNKHNI